MTEKMQRSSLYKTKAWYRLRTKQLMASPLCAFCYSLGRVKVADIVDHIKPHKGDANLFHDPENLQSLCKRCHDSVKKRLEQSGYETGCDVTGAPLDKNSHWHKS